MKKLIIITSILLFSLSVSAQKDTTKPEKVYIIRLTESEVTNLYNLLEFSKSALSTSDASAKSVTAAIQAAIAFQATLSKQYQAQNPQPKKVDK